MNYEWIPVADCDPPHRISHPEKVDELAEQFLRGHWGVGFPALVGYRWATLDNFSERRFYSTRVQLLSGTHRLAAAYCAGLQMIPVVIYPVEYVENCWGNLDAWRELMNAPQVLAVK